MGLCIAHYPLTAWQCALVCPLPTDGVALCTAGDFAYEHVTIENGRPIVGGYEGSYQEKGAQSARAFRQKWSEGVVRNCSAPETSEAGAPLRRTYYVAHHFCPLCEGSSADNPFGTLGSPPHSQRLIALPALLD
jgi:hypothetical protein